MEAPEITIEELPVTKPLPEFSIGEGPTGLQVKIDDGKFMDTCYLYDKVELDKEGNLTYSTKLLSLIVNGVLRDEVEVQIKDEALLAEFYESVATPVITEIANMASS